MPEPLEDMRRRLEAEPDDPERRRLYEAALAREGRDEELAASLMFRYACPRTWDELTHGPSEDVRSCRSCEKEVTFVRDVAQLERCAAEGACIAATEAMLRAYAARQASRLAAGEASAEPGCLVEMSQSDVDLLTGPKRLGSMPPPPQYRRPPAGLVTRIWRRLTGE